MSGEPLPEQPGQAPAPARSRRRGRPEHRPGRVRRWVVRPFLWGIVLLVALLAGAYFLLQSQLARGRAASLVVQRLSQYLGRDIEVGAVDYTFFPLAFELQDLVIPGPRPGDPPVAAVPLVRIQSSWRDLRQQVLQLEQIDVVSPRIYLQWNTDGTSNLPEIRPSTGGRSRFQTRIGRMLVQDGTLQVNHRRLPLDLDASAVWARAVGAGTGQGERLDILATAQEVVTTLPEARPYPLTVSARSSFFLRQGRLRLDRARLAGPQVRATAAGDLAFREPRTFALTVEAEGAAELANRLGYLEEPITGPFRFAGRFDLAGEDVRYDGRVQSPRIAFLDRVFQGIDARLDGTPEALRIDLARVGYAGGTVGGEVTIDLAADGVPEAAGKPVTLDLAFSGLGLAPLIRDQDLPIENLTGTADGTFRYRFTTSAPLDGSGGGDVRLRAREAQSGLPLDGRVPLTLQRGVLRVDGARVTAPAQDVAVAGSYDLTGKRGRFRVQLDTADLGALTPLLPLEKTAEPAAWLPTAGRGRAEADLAVTPAGLDARITLALQDVAAPGLAVDGVRGGFRFRPGAIDELDVTAERGAGTLAVRGRIPLPAEGQVRGGAPLALAADLRSWPAASLAALVPGAPPLAGTVTAQADLGGTFDRLNGRALATVEDLAVQGNRVGRVRADMAFDGALVLVESATVEMPAGTVLVQGRLDRAAERLSLVVDAPGLSLAEEPLSSYLRGLTGEATLAASFEGPLARPEATLRLAGSGLTLAGRPLGEAGRAEVLATWDGAAVRASGSLLGLLAFEGGGRLDRQGADVAFQLGSDNLLGLARIGLQQAVPEFQGSFAGQVTARADFGAGTYRAELALPELVARYEGREIRNLEPVVVALTSDRLQIASVYLGEVGAPAGQETELFLNGTIGLGGEETPLDLRIQSTLPVQWAELFAPSGFDLEGNVDLLATVRGTVSDPLLNGQGELRGARMVVPQFPHSLEEIRGTLLFNRNQVEVENLRGRIGGGRLLASGRFALPQEGRPLDYRLQVVAEDLSLRYPEGFLIRGDAEIALVANGAGRQVRGTVDLERAFYLEDVELGTFQLLQRVFQRERLQVAETDEALAATTLNVLVRGPGALRVRNNVADLRGDIDLAVRGTLARPVVFGQVEITRGGKLIYADNEYEIERGLLTFSNPYRIDPVIDLTAHTEVKNFDITLNISGTLEGRLNVDFTTDAGLADLEVIALLATGQELQEDGTLQQGQGSGFSAQDFLAGQAASVVSKRVGKLFGFDRFRISPLEGESGSAVSGVGITVGKRLSRDLFVTYTSRPTAPEGDLLQAEWQVANNVTLVLTAQENNTYAVDVQWERRF